MAGQSFYTWFVSFAAALGGLLFGYEIGIINSVLEMDPFKLFYGLGEIVGEELVKTSDATARTSLIVSSFVFGCIPGAFFIAAFADKLGRKKSLFIGSTLFSIGGIVQAAVTAGSVGGRVTTMVIGRFLGGIGIGILSMSAPLYIAELAPTHLRGRVTSVQQLMITIGIAIASIANAIIIAAFGNKRENNDGQWRLALGLQAVPGVLLLALLFILPESPRWLLSVGRDDDALKNLSQLRQAEQSSNVVQTEYKEFKDAIEAEQAVGSASWGELMRPGIRNRLVIGVMLQFFQQWTGINAVMYYSSSLFIAMGIPKTTATTFNVVAQSLVNVFGTFPGMYLIERMGRTALLKLGGVAMSTCMWSLVIFVNLFQSTSGLSGDGISEEAARNVPSGARVYSIIGVISMYLYVLCFASSWGPVVWVYQSEIFPQRIRGKGTGLATASNWVNNAILSAVWPFISAGLLANQYAVFGVTGLCMAAYVHFQVPETKGKSLEHMDEVFGFTGDDQPGKGEKA